MTLFDTHAHLFDDRLRPQLPAVMERAKSAGVVATVCIGTTAADSAECVAIAEQFPGHVFGCVGIQPNHVGEAAAGDWDRVVELAGSPHVVAIGESGLDRYWDRAPFELQRDLFARHLELARNLRKPLVIHCRDAAADVVEMLRTEYDRHGPIHAVMHSFTADRPSAEACLAMGLHLSFAGMVTYKNAADLRAVAAAMPLDRILVETDSPYLAPVPHRGQTNEPALVRHTAECIAKERGVKAEDFAAATTANARRFFGVP